MIIITINNVFCQINGLNDIKVIDKLDNKLSYYAPGYLFTQAYKQRRWDGKNHLINSQLKFQTGLLPYVENILRKENIQYNLKDNRQDVITGPSIGLLNTYHALRDYQQDIVNAAVINKTGLIKSATGSGKSLCIAAIVGKLNIKSVIYVVSLDLLYQMKENIEDALGVECGIIGDGNCVVKKFTVATPWTVIHAYDKKYNPFDDEQAYTKNEQLDQLSKIKIQKMVENAQMFIIDECVCENENVLTQSGYKKAKNINVGEKLLTNDSNYGLVVAKKQFEKQCIRITTASGGFTDVSTDHPFAVATANGIEYKKASELSLDDILIEYIGERDNTNVFDIKSYLMGLFYGDGHRLYKHIIRYSVSKDREFWSVIVPNLYKIAYKDVEVQVSTNIRNDLLVVIKSKILEKELDTLSIPVGKKSNTIQWPKNQLNLKSFIGGLYDADGNLSPGGQVNISATCIELLKEFHLYLRHQHIDANFQLRNHRKDKKHKPLALVSVPNCFIDEWKNTCFSILERKKTSRKTALEEFKTGNAKFLMRFCQELNNYGIRPYALKELFGKRFFEKKINTSNRTITKENLLNSISLIRENIDRLIESIPYDFIAKFYNIHPITFAVRRHRKPEETQKIINEYREKTKKEILEKLYNEKFMELINNTNFRFLNIKNIISLNKQTVVNFQVEPQNTFIVNNLLTHNCQFMAADSIQLITKASKNARYRLGFSGTPWRDGGDDILLEAATGRQLIDINATTLINKGVLVPPKIYFFQIPKLKGLEMWDRKPYARIYDDYIVENITRNEIIIESATKLFAKKRKILILVKRKKHGLKLLEMMPKNIKTYYLNGDATTDERNAVKDLFNMGGLDIIIASSIFDQGIDLPKLDALILAGSGKSSTRALQRLGRVIRGADGKTDAIVVDFIDHAPYLYEHSRKRWTIYTTEPAFQIKLPSGVDW